ncbi:hypothetical protein QYE76_066789 [Lolium multiflorum]|uniref:Integrase zinc-binding domain-containing protein n=1 Tax=Lolium multiflorum TaxID=4521 RepID=A0AAD8SC41_LOLMU|nr:hypothetical protein QYE76_066789 [Lolium multiflorum]
MNYHTCGGKGHFKRDFPNRKVMIINDNDEYETGDDVDPYAPEDDDYDSDGVDAYLSEPRTIVVSHHALNVQASASTQRCNLFQTKALVGPDKACKESHAGGLMGHFGREKTLLMLADHFYWPKMRRDVDKVKRADFVRKIHVKTKELIEKKGKNNAARVNKKRKEMLFKPGDMVWVHFCKDRYEEGANIARGGEEQLDMVLDMKTLYGCAREEREACTREEEKFQAGAQPGQTGRHAGLPGRTPGPTGSHGG